MGGEILKTVAADQSDIKATAETQKTAITSRRDGISSHSITWLRTRQELLELIAEAVKNKIKVIQS